MNELKRKSSHTASCDKATSSARCFACSRLSKWINHKLFVIAICWTENVSTNIAKFFTRLMFATRIFPPMQNMFTRLLLKILWHSNLKSLTVWRTQRAGRRSLTQIPDKFTVRIFVSEDDRCLTDVFRFARIKSSNRWARNERTPFKDKSKCVSLYIAIFRVLRCHSIFSK